MIPLVAAWAASLIACWFGGLWASKRRADYYEAQLQASRRAYGFLEQSKRKEEAECELWFAEARGLKSANESLERQLAEVAKDNARLIAEGSAAKKPSRKRA